MSSLPPCGLYRTVAPIGDLPAGRLVYFHNHGNPGAGIYFPESWTHNRAKFTPQGRTLPEDFDYSALQALPAEGFYRVRAAFYCCGKKCVEFSADQLLQLGYNGAGRAIVFVPEIEGGVIRIPERGTGIDDDVLQHLVPLKLREAPDVSVPRGILIH